MAVVVQQQSMIVVNQEWGSGICDCCEDMSICCCAFWCFPCFVCKTIGELNENYCLSCFDAGFTPPVSLALRYGIRKQYGIQGDLCNDCLLVTYCNACSWCQVAREIKRRKQGVTMVTAQPLIVQNQPMRTHAY